jgi:hypothetical protein
MKEIPNPKRTLKPQKLELQKPENQELGQVVQNAVGMSITAGNVPPPFHQIRAFVARDASFFTARIVSSVCAKS